jgi:ATP-binding cassette subfamily B (MDR/TAP) protein 1
MTDAQPHVAPRTTTPENTEDESYETQPLLESDSDIEEHVSVRHSTQWERHVEPSLATVQPQAFQDVTAFRQQFIRQILGLNPFKTSYFALFKSLDDTASRTILALGIALAILAGVPLRTFSRPVPDISCPPEALTGM